MISLPRDETRVRALIFNYLWDCTDFEQDECDVLADGLYQEFFEEFAE